MRLGSYVTRELFPEVGSQEADGVLIDLKDGQHVRPLPTHLYDEIKDVEYDSIEEMREAVEEAVEESGEEWQKERGPDSELAKNMEAGTPTTAHDSDPTQ